MIRHHHSLWSEGTDVGLIGGVLVALFFTIRDVLTERLFATPNVLGQIIVLGRGTPDLTTLVPEAIWGYTAVHFAAFVVFGIALTHLVHLATREPVFRYALLSIFIVFEVFFLGVTLTISEETRALFPAWMVVSANTIAALGMGYYLWKKHPGIKRAIGRVPLGAARVD
jgi:hypothetical protein